MGSNNEVSRRHIRQTLTNYTKAYNHNGHHIEAEPRPYEAQYILDDFKKIVGQARARDIPALALEYLPVPPERIIVAFDYRSVNKYTTDDSNILIVITKTGAEISWHDANISITKKCR